MLGSVVNSRVGEVPAIIAAPYTLTATVDPTAANDISQGWQVGSVWFNAAPGFLRWWECRSNALGAASWVFAGADYTNGGDNPPNETTQFGSGTGAMFEEGLLYRHATAGTNPAGTAGNYVVDVFTIPANSFDVANRGVNITAMGSVANNTNAKTVSIYYGCTTAVIGSLVTGGTVIASTGAYSTTGAAAWQLVANVYKYGAAGSNTQIGLHETVQIGSTVPALTVPQLLTATESSPVLVALVANAATTATDISAALFSCNAMN